MRRYATVLLAVFCATVSADATASPEASIRPRQEIRELRRLQARAAAGDREAHRRLPAEMSRLASQWLAHDEETWRDKEDLGAAISLVLSGGPPGVLRRILGLGSLDPETAKIARGAMAQLEGPKSAVLRLWADIEPETLPSTLAAQFALAKATSLLDSDADKARKLLDKARLLAPGSLIEEVALRRTIFLVAEKGQLDLFVDFSQLYMLRFGRSPYADNVRDRIMSMSDRLAVAESKDADRRLLQLVGLFKESDRSALLVAVGRAALYGGALKRAVEATTAVGRIVPPNSAFGRPATLYLAAARVADVADDGPLASLVELDPRMLGGKDVALRAAAIAVARHVRRWPPRGDSSHVPTEEAPEILGQAEDVARAITDLLSRAP